MALSKVEICGVDTAKLPVLKHEEMEKLLLQMQNGDHAAREKMINGNLRLVLSVIQRFANRGESADDLFQVGCIGLIKAIDHFDTGHNVRFSTYAVPMIIGEIRRHLRDYNSIRVSRSLRDIAYRSLKAREKLTSDLGREPTVEELSKELEVKVEDVVLALDSVQDPVSLYEPVYQDGSDALFVMDQLKDEKEVDTDLVNSIALKDALLHLSEREKSILLKRFFEGRTQMEVAQEIGISQAQVSRLEKAALGHMRKYV